MAEKGRKKCTVRLGKWIVQIGCLLCICPSETRPVPPEVHLAAASSGLLRGRGKWRVISAEEANLT